MPRREVTLRFRTSVHSPKHYVCVSRRQTQTHARYTHSCGLRVPVRTAGSIWRCIFRSSSSVPQPVSAKSTVVRELMHASQRSYRFINVVPAQLGMLGFLQAFARCTLDVAPAIASSFVAVYDRMCDLPDAPEQLAAWLAGNLERLDALFVVDGIDGVDGVDGSAQLVRRLLATLIDCTPANVRWVVAGESRKQFPLARWLAQERMAIPIDESDLALTAADLMPAARLQADSPSDSECRDLCEVAAGWPVLVALALANWPAVDLGVARAQGVRLHRYLLETMLANLSAGSREFLMQTCLLRSFDAALLRCAGYSVIDAVLTELGSRLALLVRRAHEPYEYDRHVRAFVIERLRAADDGAFDRVAIRSAAAYEAAERYADAIDIHAMREDRAALGRLITAHGFAMIDRGESDAVQRALSCIPHDVLLGFPAALAVKASLASLQGKTDIAEAWFRIALASVLDDAQRHAIVFRFATDLVRRERPDAIDVLEPFVATIATDVASAAPMLALLATAYASHERLSLAAATIDRALELLPQVCDPSAHAKIICQAGFVALSLGKTGHAKSYAQTAYHAALAAYAYDVAARALSILYCIAMDDEDDVRASRTYVRLLAEASGRAGSRQLLLYATLCSYEIEVYAGNLPAIERLNDQLTSLEVFYSVLTTETLLPSQALQATWNGDFERAYELLEASGDQQVTPARRAYRFAEIGLYAAAADLHAEALSAVEMSLAIVPATPAGDKTAQITQAYIALTFVLLQYHTRAAALLSDLESQPIENARTALLIRSVRALEQRWRTSATSADLPDVLERLEASDLGGIARMIEALPLPRYELAAART